MRPSFHPRLINDPFSDPGVFIPFLFERRALLFDLGDLSQLTARDRLRVSQVFVSHGHMDHFIGFDALLRTFLGRETQPHLFGPAGFLDHVEGKLAGYTWNLVADYPGTSAIKATEVGPETMRTRVYPCREGFRPEKGIVEAAFSGVLLREPAFQVEAALLDHGVPCLGFSLVENFHINIDRSALRELRLSAGPWLTRFKRALYDLEDLSREFTATWKEAGEVVKERRFVLGELAEKIARITPGQKISYITDIHDSPENHEKAVELARKADHLFIEAAFLDCDRHVARRKYHLTAREAGAIAREAGARRLSLCHFSPRYRHRSQAIVREAMEAFGSREKR